MSRDLPLGEVQANQIYEVLVNLAGARADDVDSFAHYITRPVAYSAGEWRFQGALGFGGKFYRGTGHRPDGTIGESWWVSCYPEDSNEAREQIIADTNAALNTLLTAHLELHPEQNGPLS